MLYLLHILLQLSVNFCFPRRDHLSCLSSDFQVPTQKFAITLPYTHRVEIFLSLYSEYNIYMYIIMYILYPLPFKEVIVLFHFN